MASRLADIEEYLSLEPLATRIETHRRYSRTPDDVEQAVLDGLNLDGGEHLLDVGPGTGSFLRRIAAGHQGRLVGVDVSPTVVAGLRAIDGVEGQRGDAVRLPFADATFDVVTARHMLYHVADPARAIAEARRVLSPGGRFVAVVNHDQVLPKVNALVAHAIVESGLSSAEAWAPAVHTDSLPPLIEAEFGAVEVIRFDNALEFIEAEPLIRFAVAQLAFHGIPPDSPRRVAIVEHIDHVVRTELAEVGEWCDDKGYSVSLARVG